MIHMYHLNLKWNKHNKCLSKPHCTDIFFRTNVYQNFILRKSFPFLELFCPTLVVFCNYACFFSSNIKTCNILCQLTLTLNTITPNPLLHFYIPIRCFLHIIGGSISYAFVITTSFCKLFMRIDTKENISQGRRPDSLFLWKCVDYSP